MGQLSCGNLVAPAATNVTGISFANGQLITGDVSAITGINFTSIQSALSSNSSNFCSSQGVNATVGAGNRITFTGSNNFTQIFTINASVLASASAITFNFSNASAVGEVIVNVVGSNVTFSGFDTNLGSLPAGLLTWNICSANNVSISSFNFRGNLLAPNASVTIGNAQIAGLVAARTLTGTGGGEVHLPTCP